MKNTGTTSATDPHLSDRLREDLINLLQANKDPGMGLDVAQTALMGAYMKLATIAGELCEARLLLDYSAHLQDCAGALLSLADQKIPCVGFNISVRSAAQIQADAEILATALTAWLRLQVARMDCGPDAAMSGLQNAFLRLVADLSTEIPNITQAARLLLRMIDDALVDVSRGRPIADRYEEVAVAMPPASRHPTKH